MMTETAPASAPSFPASCSAFRVGRELFEVLVDDITGQCEMLIWEVRTIRGGKITAIQRNKFTWVKLSKAHRDWGWAPVIDPLWRTTWLQAGRLPSSLSTTRKAAWRNVVTQAKQGRLYIDSPEIVAKVVATATRQSRQNTVLNEPTTP